MERHHGLRAPSTSKLANQGKGMKASVAVVVPGKDLAAVAPSTTATAAVVSWGGNRMKQGKNHMGKPISRHLT
jgi:hypothetical protein